MAIFIVDDGDLLSKMAIHPLSTMVIHPLSTVAIHPLSTFAIHPLSNRKLLFCILDKLDINDLISTRECFCEQIRRPNIENTVIDRESWDHRFKR